jgi:fucose permease
MLAVIVGVVLFWWHPLNVANLVNGIYAFRPLGIALWWNPANAITFIGLVIIGVAQAPVFPLLMSDTAQRVGAEYAENGVSMQMAAVGVGTAILPGLIGTIGQNFGLETMAATFVIMSVIIFGFHELTILGRARQPVPVVAQN